MYKPNWIDAATTTGATASEDVQGLTHFALSAVGTGGAETRVDLQGSVDGAHWFTLCRVITGNSGAASFHHSVPIVSSSALPDGQSVTSGGVVRLLRANVISITGGSSPTVSASLYAF